MTELKNISLNNYNSALNTLDKFHIDYSNPHEVESFLNNKNYSDTTRKTYYYALFHALKDSNLFLSELYRELGYKYSKKSSDNYKNQIITPNELDKYLSYTEIQNTWLKAKDDDSLDDQWKLFFAFNVLIPPLRLDLNYLHVFSKIHPPPPDFSGNHIILLNRNYAQIIIIQHKTDFNGPLTRDIPSHLIPLLIKVSKTHPILFQVSPALS